MSRRTPIFYSALLLTGVNLLLRLALTGFQVYLSARIGPAGIGLLQLVMSVGGFAMIAGMAGIRTGTMYLTAEELGKQNGRNLPWVLSGCFLYSIICSGMVALGLYHFAPIIAGQWIGDLRTVSCLRLYAAFLPVVCLCGVMSGLFTAQGRIGTLAAVEIGEQAASMAITMAALTLWAGTSPVRACQSVILGSSIGACLTLSVLVVLYGMGKPSAGERIPIRRRLLQTALPLALGDMLKSGINTTENLMVPKRLAMHPLTAQPLAAFGMVTGMVFPVLMFPACILFGLAELLIPELARCRAADSHKRIVYLVRRSLKVAMVYGILLGGILFLLSGELCQRLYGSREAGVSLGLYAVLVPMLYCDAIVDAMTKGLGQQTVCVRYNILTSAMDVGMLFFLLPKAGMNGYFLSFAISHLVNFCLSLGRLLKICNMTIPLSVPLKSLSCALFAAAASMTLSHPALRVGAYCAICLCTLYLLNIIRREDVLWLKGLVGGK